MSVQRLVFECVTVEDPPLTSFYDPVDYTPEDRLIAAYDDLQEPWSVALNEVCDAKDSTHCWRCNAPIGYVARGDNDHLRWTSVFLVRGEATSPVAVLCEDCVPDVPQAPYPWAQAHPAVKR